MLTHARAQLARACLSRLCLCSEAQNSPDCTWVGGSATERGAGERAAHWGAVAVIKVLEEGLERDQIGDGDPLVGIRSAVACPVKDKLHNGR